MKMRIALIRQYWLPISALLLTVITVLSLWPAESLPDVPGNDKLHHYIAYTALMLPTALRRPARWLWIGLFFFTWSGAIELIQPYVNRYGEWLDLGANAVGLLSGIILALIIQRWVPLQTIGAGDCMPRNRPPVSRHESSKRLNNRIKSIHRKIRSVTQRKDTSKDIRP